MNTRTQILVAVLAGQLVGLLGYVEQVFIPLVLAGPLVVGALAAARRIPLVTVVVLWLSAGLNMTVMDWVLYREDVAFHLVLGVVMAVLAAAGHGLVGLLNRRRAGVTT